MNRNIPAILLFAGAALFASFATAEDKPAPKEAASAAAPVISSDVERKSWQVRSGVLELQNELNSLMSDRAREIYEKLLPQKSQELNTQVQVLRTICGEKHDIFWTKDELKCVARPPAPAPPPQTAEKK